MPQKRVPKKTKKAAPTKRKPMTAAQKIEERRYEIRRIASQTTFVGISFNLTQGNTPFKPDLAALLIDDSVNGCSLVFLKENPLTSKLEIGKECLIQIDTKRTLKGVVRWVNTLDRRLLNVGFKFV